MLESILDQLEPAAVLQVDKQKFVPIDLSKDNPDLLNIDVSNTSHFEAFINNYLKENDAEVAYGGYNEPRNIYKRSSNFNAAEKEERFIHLGIDLWAKAYTPICAPLKGKVHSFSNNLGLGNYGPTIILEHIIKKHKFYTLYGHLTKDSIDDLIVGEPIDAGEMIGAIGNYPVNGDYPPHLHFQIIRDLNGMIGDFPGVTSLNKRELDLQNCANPNIILRLE